MDQANYFLIRLREDQPYDYMQRWHTPSGVALRESVIAALAAGQDLPGDIPMLEAEFANGMIKLVDLRGIDLSGLVVGEVDLSYCCFDRANFSGSQFEGTHLQYSSMNGAKFNSAKWIRVQASPISARGASFKDATIQNSFLMHSNLDCANFRNAIVRETPLVGCMLGYANLSTATQLVQIDITQATLYDGEEFVRLAALPNVIGVPRPVIVHHDNNSNESSPFNDLPTTLSNAEKLARRIVNAWAIGATTNSLVPDVAFVGITGGFLKGYYGNIDKKLIHDVANAFGVQHYTEKEVIAAIDTGIAANVMIADGLSFLPGVGGIIARVAAAGIRKKIGETLINYMKTRSSYK